MTLGCARLAGRANWDTLIFKTLFVATLLVKRYQMYASIGSFSFVQRKNKNYFEKSQWIIIICQQVCYLSTEGLLRVREAMLSWLLCWRCTLLNTREKFKINCIYPRKYCLIAAFKRRLNVLFYQVLTIKMKNSCRSFLCNQYNFSNSVNHSKIFSVHLLGPVGWVLKITDENYVISESSQMIKTPINNKYT